MDKYTPKNMLVTGSAGFIGSNFVRFVLQNSDDVNVISLDKLTYAGRKENLANLPNPNRHTFIHGDICDADLVAKIMREYEIDTILHFAAESHVDRSISGPAAFLTTNVVGTFTLLETAKQYWLAEKKLTKKQCRFHHVSTDEVYGQLGVDDPSFCETSPYMPSSPYAASKASSDHFVMAYCRTFGLPLTLSRCSNNYGPYQHEEKFIPTVISACIAEKPISIYGDGSNIRDWLYVEDHCRAIAAIIHNGAVGETYNIGGNCERDNLSLAQMICAIMDQRKPLDYKYQKLIQFVSDRPGHDWRYAINSNKIQTKLGWEPRWDLMEGLETTVNYYLKICRGRPCAYPQR